MNQRLLLTNIQTAKVKFTSLLDQLSPAQMIQPDILGKWSVKDTLAHITVHEQRMLSWMATRLRGEIPAAPQPYAMPDEPLAVLNESIYAENRERALEDILKDLEQTYERVLELISSAPEALLFDPGCLRLENDEPLWAAVAANTYEHMNEHGKEIQEAFMLDAPLIQIFGLDALLTAQDDPALWEAALSAYWPHPVDPACLVDALRFDVGRRLAEGEIPQDETNSLHATMRGMVDIVEWCFERVDDSHLRVKACPAPAAPPVSSFLGAGLSGMLMPAGGVISAGQPAVPYTPPPQVVFIYLGVTRPSLGADQAVVYSATSAPGVGDGKALLWQRQADGTWHPTDQRVAWWIT